jgi:hypothetical protein
MGVLGGALVLIAMFMGLLIAPLVLGSYVVAGDQPFRLTARYFGLVTAAFVLVLIAGVLATIALSTP